MARRAWKSERTWKRRRSLAPRPLFVLPHLLPSKKQQQKRRNKKHDRARTTSMAERLSAPIGSSWFPCTEKTGRPTFRLASSKLAPSRPAKAWVGSETMLTCKEGGRVRFRFRFWAEARRGEARCRDR